MEEVINLSEAEYNSYLFKRTLGEGQRGRVYPYNKRYVIKLWDETLSSDIIYAYQKNVKNLVEGNYHTLYTPEKLVVVNDEIKGYLMKYFPGINLRDLHDLTSFKALLSSLKNLEVGLLKFANTNRCVDDCHDENIMYYEKLNKGIMICTDCDSWYKSYDKSKESCFKHNITEVNSTIVNTLFRSGFTDDIVQFIWYNASLRSRLEAIDLSISTELSSFIIDVKKELENYTNKKISTVGDLKRILK